MSHLRAYFQEYAVTRDNFDTFHNQVINMPRDSFTNVDLGKLQTLAAYLLLVEDVVPADGISYQDLISLIASKIRQDVFPSYHRDLEMEQLYFIYADLQDHYKRNGRMFRHLMATCSFFGMLTSYSRTNKIINFDKCREYALSSNEVLIPIARNNIINVNVNSNDFIRRLHGISIGANANYRPTYGILKYIKEIGRPVTKFELAILLGRIDQVQTEREVIARALTIGRRLPIDSQQAQIEYVFRKMGWIDTSGNLFSYAQSQQPEFKFNTYFLYLEAFGLVLQRPVDKKIVLTNYAAQLLNDSIPFNIADLEALINLLSEDVSDITLRNILITQYDKELMAHLVEDTNFIKKMNRRSLAHPVIIDGVRKRNKFIAELAKIKTNYTCQAGSTTFRQSNGRNYVEAHHIIEFAKGGPDIIDNLLVLGPTPHALLHKGAVAEIQNLYNHLKLNGAISLNLFQGMITEYNCLSKEHLELLADRKLISLQQKAELAAMVVPT